MPIGSIGKSLSVTFWKRPSTVAPQSPDFLPAAHWIAPSSSFWNAGSPYDSLVWPRPV